MVSADEDFIRETVLSNFAEVEGIYLCGSHANNSSSESSDIDVVFLTQARTTISSLKNFKLKTELEVKLGKVFDLIHLNSSSTVFQFQIVITGVQLFAKNFPSLLAYEAMIRSQYQRFNEERRGIIEEIISFGKVYTKLNGRCYPK